jgi:hypothetical protein
MPGSLFFPCEALFPLQQVTAAAPRSVFLLWLAFINAEQAH